MFTYLQLMGGWVGGGEVTLISASAVSIAFFSWTRPGVKYSADVMYERLNDSGKTFFAPSFCIDHRNRHPRGNDSSVDLRQGRRRRIYDQF